MPATYSKKVGSEACLPLVGITLCLINVDSLCFRTLGTENWRYRFCSRPHKLIGHLSDDKRECLAWVDRMEKGIDYVDTGIRIFYLWPASIYFWNCMWRSSVRNTLMSGKQWVYVTLKYTHNPWSHSCRSEAHTYTSIWPRNQSSHTALSYCMSNLRMYWIHSP